MEKSKTEIWKDIQGYQGYQASSLGHVRQKGGGVNLKVSPDRGFVKVLIKPTEEKKKVYVHVHKLIAQTFLGLPPNKGMKITHLNSKKDDNRAENLAFSTQSEILLKAAAAGRKPDNRGSRNNKAILHEAQVEAIRNAYKNGYVKASALAVKYKVKESTIKCIIKRKTWKHI